VKLIIAIITLRGLEILIDDLLKKNNLNEKSGFLYWKIFKTEWIIFVQIFITASIDWQISA
jgi:hypothetical protein